MASSEPLWETSLVGPQSKASPLFVFKDSYSRNFEFIAKLQSGSAEYILGVTCNSTGTVQTVLEDKHAHAYLKKIGSNPHAPWASLTNDLQVLCDAETQHVRLMLFGGFLSFVHGSSEQDVLSTNCTGTTVCLPSDKCFPCVLTCWSDTRVACKFRKWPHSWDRCSLGFQLHKDPKFTDATIRCCDQDIAVHRAVLATASPVFNTMFSSGMQEAQDATLEIKDAAPATVHHMIKYIYTEELDDTSDLAQMFELANKYMMPRLAWLVGENMAKTLNQKNAVEYCKVVRQHVSLDNDAKVIWEVLYSKLAQDQDNMRVVFEGLIDDSLSSHVAKLFAVQ